MNKGQFKFPSISRDKCLKCGRCYLAYVDSGYQSIKLKNFKVFLKCSLKAASDTVMLSYMSSERQNVDGQKSNGMQGVQEKQMVMMGKKMSYAGWKKLNVSIWIGGY